MLLSKQVSTSLKSFLLLTAIFISGCIKSDDFDYDKIAGTNWDPDFAVPLINSSLGMENLTGFSNSTTIGVDSNDLVHLIYTANIYSVYGYQFMPLIDQNNSQTITLSPADSSTLYQSGTITRNFSIIFPFAMSNGEQLDSMLLRLGSLTVSIQSQIPHSGTVAMTIPDATLNGVAYSQTIPFTYSGSTPVTAGITDNVAGYKLNFTGNGSYNQLRINYSVSISNSSTSAPTANRNFTINTGFNSLAMAEAYGYFGQRSLNITGDSSRIELFNNALFGNISFKDPKITFNISNSFGFPVNAQLNLFNAISNNGTTTPITGSIPNPLPVLTPVSLGQIAKSSFFIDKTNSNISTVMDQNPRFIEFDVDALSNSPTPGYNFISDSSLFSVDADVDLPMIGSASGFTISDTTDFELEDVNEVQKATFRINVENGFPAEAYVQVYFADSNYVIVDSLLTNASQFVVASGLLDANNRVILPNRQMRDEEFTKTRLERIYTARKLIILSIVNTQNAPIEQVPIYSYYRLNIKIGVRAFLNVEL